MEFSQGRTHFGYGPVNIHNSCGLALNKEILNVLFEDNVTRIAQMKSEYIKGDKTLEK